MNNIFNITFTMDTTNVSQVDATVTDANALMGDTLVMAQNMRQELTVSKEEYELYKAQLEDTSAKLRESVAGAQEELRELEDELTELARRRGELEEANRRIEETYSDAQLRTRRIQNEVAEVERQTDEVARDLTGLDEYFRQKQEEYVRLRESLTTSETELGNLKVEVEKVKEDIKVEDEKVKKLKWSVGQMMTTASLVIRLTRNLTKGMNKDVDRFMSLLASMFSHLASLAWQAAALASLAGNPWMAGLHAGIAVTSMMQQMQVQAEREAHKQVREYDSGVNDGTRPY